MAQEYVDNPLNIREITPYVLMNREEICNEILMADRCFFYDACAFRRHLAMSNPDYLFEYIKKKSGIVVITRCIIMELASTEKMLCQEYIEYIRKMSDAGIRILLMYEEDLFYILNQCFTVNAVINSTLSWAIKNVNRPTSSIELLLDHNQRLRQEILVSPSSDSLLYARFFQEIRAYKEQGDNLGEELIGICLHILSSIPDTNPYEYIVMTDDKGAIGLMNRVARNVMTHYQQDVCTISALSMPGLTQRLYEEGILKDTDVSDMEELLSVGIGSGQKVSFIGLEEYDLIPQEKKMSCSEMAHKIVTPNGLHIVY